MRQYPYFGGLFHISTPLRSVELRMEKVSRDLVASTGHLWRILKEGNALKVLESERLRTLKLVGIECLILVHSRKFVFLTFFAICS